MDFRVNVGAKVTDDIQKQLNSFSKKTITVTPIVNTKGMQVGKQSITTYKNDLNETVKVTEKFRLGVISALFAILAVRILHWILGFFGSGLPFLYSGGTIGIGISLVIVGVAALCLILDFDLIDRYSQAGVPKYMEWYCSLSLMVTLVWLYLEILRLLALFRER